MINISKIVNMFLLLTISLFLSVLIITNQRLLESYNSLNKLRNHPEESAGFRNMCVTKDFLDSVKEMEHLTAYMLDHGFQGEHTLTDEELQIAEERAEAYMHYDKNTFDRICSLYRSVLQDLKYFPVAGSVKSHQKNVFFDNSWMFERNYGGVRGHEGTDIMPVENRFGYYPIISMTDGTVEKVGWLDKGGYRIGIRSPHGAYFYYAHLSSYMKDFKVGDSVKAGEPLGYMGNTGYGPEGTYGQFDTHLHMGLYLTTDRCSELSVNPYWILKYMEDRRIYYNF